MRYLAVSVAVFVPGGLVAPTIAPGQQPTHKPKLTATPESVFPDRTYMLQLPPGAARPKLVLTENGGPVMGLAISAPGGSVSGTYAISYRSVLPPQVKAVVSATITGFPAATTTYTTPALDDTASENLERRWVDSPYVTIVVIVAVLALMALALRTRPKHRDWDP
jgi:hypothetical protein